MKHLKTILCLSLLICCKQAVASSTWPNEAAGSVVLSDFNFDSKTGNGWGPVHPEAGAIVTDNTAPLSAPNVLQYTWNHNAGYGDASVETFGLPIGTREFYMGVKWKPSNPFSGWTVENQKIFLLDGTRNHMYITMHRKNNAGNRYDYGINAFYGTAGADNCHVAQKLSCDHFLPNVTNPSVQLGVWHTLEAYYKGSTSSTSRDGILRYWLDGVLLANYTNINTAYPDHRKVQINPVWDNFEPSCPTCVDHHWFDHVRVSAPAGTLPPFVISTGTLPSGQSGISYSAYLQASGGKGLYSWTVASGSLPPGLTLNKITGAITGIPASGGTSNFSVKVSDALVPPQETTKQYTIVVSGPQSSIGATRNTIRKASIALGARGAADRVDFNLEFASEGKFSVEIFDLQGRGVWSYSGLARKGTLAQTVWNHGGKLKKGVYLVRAKQNGRTAASNYCHVR